MTVSYLIILGIIAILSIGVNPSFGEVVIITSVATSPDCGYNDECVEPRVITIAVGEEVLWVPYATGTHIIVSGSIQDGPTEFFDSGEFSGIPFLLKFEEEGTFPYYSPIRPWIQGVVIVDGSIPPDTFPNWTKFLISAWGNYYYGESQFLRSMEYLIENDFIQTSQPESYPTVIPDWVRNIARWWGQEAITDDDFVNVMENLIEREIIRLSFPLKNL